MSMLTQERLKEVLRYEPEEGVFFWIKVTSNRAAIDRPAGTAMPDGRKLINVDGRRYLVSRLAFFYMRGRWPTCWIDHINHDTSDNRWANLREADPSQNQGNKVRQKNNLLGVKGVQKWHNRYRVLLAGKYVGLYASIEEAKYAYMTAAKKRWGTFAYDGESPQ